MLLSLESPPLHPITIPTQAHIHSKTPQAYTYKGWLQMGSNVLSCNYEDEEFIDMEVSSSHSSSPSKSKEFEFHMGSSIVHSNSPADELFYQGKLLPLHLPPRAQMVKSLLQNAKFKQVEQDQEEFITFTTPMVQSCNISPSESCRVSTELTPDEYFFEWSTELTGFIGDHPKKYYTCPWSKKLKLIKNSSITQKLKSSRAYFKSLFNKSSCGTDGNPCAKQEVEQECDNTFLKKYLKVTKKSGFGHVQTRKYPTLANVLKGIEEQGNEDGFDTSCTHRKSFSGAIKRKCSPSTISSCSSNSASGTSSSSSSFNYSNGVHELKLLKRNSSADSELEGSIEAAIDHCKKSQQVFNSRNPVFFSKCTL
ncbi:probable membrane-associated kinase regulator 4 [Tanacetum coccineum]